MRLIGASTRTGLSPNRTTVPLCCLGSTPVVLLGLQQWYWDTSQSCWPEPEEEVVPDRFPALRVDLCLDLQGPGWWMCTGPVLLSCSLGADQGPEETACCQLVPVQISIKETASSYLQSIKAFPEKPVDPPVNPAGPHQSETCCPFQPSSSSPSPSLVPRKHHGLPLLSL